VILKLPPENVAILVDRLLLDLENYSLVGYLLFLPTLAGWYIHAKHQRQVISEEMERLARERDKLQGQSLGKGVQSSGGH